MQNVGIGTERLQRNEAIEREEKKMREWAKDRLRAFQARQAREEREIEERRQKRADDIEHEKQEREWRKENAEMWTKPGLPPLAQPPILTGERFSDTYMPSDLRFRCLFPADPGKRSHMKNLLGEFGALHDYTNWAGDVMAPAADDARRGFYERLANDASEDTMLVFLETKSLFAEASELGRFEFCFCDDRLVEGKLGTKGLRRRLLEGGPFLEHENGLYSYRLEESAEPRRREIWRRYGALVPTEMERFQYKWIGENGDTRLVKELTMRGAAVFEGWTEEISKVYGHLVPTPAQMIEWHIQQSLTEYGNTRAIEEQMMLWNDANIESLGELFLQTYGHMIRPSLERFQHQYTAERIEYIRLWEPHRLSEEWGPDILTAYPLYSQLELFEHKYGAEAYEKGDKFDVENIRRKLLNTGDPESFLQTRGGPEAIKTYGHLIPSEAAKFEHEYMERREDGELRTKHIFKVMGCKVFNEGWSAAIKEKYMRYAPTDLEQFEAINPITEIEHNLMMFGGSVFDGWDNEVRAKWSPLCPTEEARFEYSYCEKEEGILKGNEKLQYEGELAFDGYSQEIRGTYLHLLSRGSRL